MKSVQKVSLEPCLNVASVEIQVCVKAGQYGLKVIFFGYMQYNVYINIVKCQDLSTNLNITIHMSAAEVNLITIM